MAEWYYIGHYGQLGPLTQEQVEELVQGGVILRETYVWRTGMAQWMPASAVAELAGAFRVAEPFAAPPPPPMSGAATMTANPSLASSGYAYAPPNMPAPFPQGNFLTIPSDRSRVLAGILNIVLPFGIGRMYLGYAAIGVMQLVLTPCGGVGAVWSIIDGIAMLCGSIKYDGYGRTLRD